MQGPASLLTVLFTRALPTNRPTSRHVHFQSGPPALDLWQMEEPFPATSLPLTPVHDYPTGCDAEGAGRTVSRAEQQPRGMKPPNSKDVNHAGACGQHAATKTLTKRGPDAVLQTCALASIFSPKSTAWAHFPHALLEPNCVNRGTQAWRSPQREHVLWPSPVDGTSRF